LSSHFKDVDKNRALFYVCDAFSEVLRFSRYLSKTFWLKTASVVMWSEFLATDPEAWVRFSALPEKKVVGLERGPLSLVSTTEELLDRKVAAPV
jgi:hypothetical protein